MNDLRDDYPNSDWTNFHHISDEESIEFAKTSMSLENHPRNEPCWCGSGLKYKRCHLKRGKRPRLSKQEIIENMKSIKSNSKCMFPVDLLEREGKIICCNRESISSHTIQKSLLLKFLSTNNLVYGVKRVFRIDKPPTLEKIGTSQASVFHGFCNEHDTKGFVELERNVFEFTAKQAFLTSYRALAYELDAKHHQKEGAWWLKSSADLGLSIVEQISCQINLNNYLNGINQAINELESIKNIFDESILTDNFDNFNFLMIEISGENLLACCGLTGPFYDFSGNEIQKLNPKETNKLESIKISILPIEESRNVFIACWLKEANFITQFIRSLLDLPKDNIPDAIIRFIFSHFENIFLKPDWWENVDLNKKDALLKRYYEGIAHITLSSHWITDDGIKYIDWKVSKIILNSEVIA